jgi:hypothetical protein
MEKSTSYRVDGSKEYEGEWEIGKFFTGKGTYYREDGTIEYEGDFVNGNYNGKGIHF